MATLIIANTTSGSSPSNLYLLQVESTSYIFYSLNKYVSQRDLPQSIYLYFQTFFLFHQNLGRARLKWFHAWLNKQRSKNDFILWKRRKVVRIINKNLNLWATDNRGGTHRSQQRISQTRRRTDDRRDEGVTRTTSIFVANYAIWCNILCQTQSWD